VCFTFLLVFFDSFAGKAFLARSIKLCLVDNQRSYGVTVAGFELCLIWSQIANVEISTSQTYRLLSEDRACISPVGSCDVQLCRRGSCYTSWPLNHQVLVDTTGTSVPVSMWTSGEKTLVFCHWISSDIHIVLIDWLVYLLYVAV
jgi:hypothetical protein